MARAGGQGGERGLNAARHATDLGAKVDMCLLRDAWAELYFALEGPEAPFICFSRLP